MQKVHSISVDKIPFKSGYHVPSRQERREKFYGTDSHIYAQGPLAGVKAGAHKFINNFLTYFPKGFSGSKNSDFYEYLSMGMVPFAVGSVMLASLYGLTNGKYMASEKFHADNLFKRTGAGVLFFATGKWLAPKISRTALTLTTGINLDKRYLNRTSELPEFGQEKGMSRVQYPGVFDSVQFYRKDLLAKDGDINHNNIYFHDDRIVKKAGFKKAKQASTNQIADEKIRGVKARATALEDISKYALAATGVAFGFQKAFGDFRISDIKTKQAKITDVFVNAAKQLWNGNSRNIFTKNAGKALVLFSAISTIAAWLIPTIKFKTNPDTMKSQIDEKKAYEVN